MTVLVKFSPMVSLDVNVAHIVPYQIMVRSLKLPSGTGPTADAPKKKRLGGNSTKHQRKRKLSLNT